MGINIMDTCKICGNQAQSTGLDPLDVEVSIDCGLCGRYILTESFNPNNYEDKSNFYKVSSWIREQNDLLSIVPEINMSKFDEILEMKDKKIQEKFDFMMFHLKEYKNQQVPPKIYAQCWVKDDNEFHKLFNRAIEHKLIKGNIYLGGEVSFDDYTFDGLQYIEKLDEPNKDSKNIFVAFNFEKSLSEIFSTYIKQGIEELGFNYVVVNQNTTEHNKAISDEIIAKLKSARVVIADFTNHRNSVYFEAGFAMGMKIPIIWTCQEGHTQDLSFDTRQYPHLIWKDGEDLKEQIINRIKVIL